MRRHVPHSRAALPARGTRPRGVRREADVSRGQRRKEPGDEERHGQPRRVYTGTYDHHASVTPCYMHVYATLMYIYPTRPKHNNDGGNDDDDAAA